MEREPRPGAATMSAPAERTMHRAWRLGMLGGGLLAAAGGLGLVLRPGDPLELARIVLLVALGVLAVIHRRAVLATLERRATEGVSAARILGALSRSTSPDAVVHAIADELVVTSGADHVVVARLETATGVVEATLVSARAGVPVSRTRLAPEAADLSSDDQPAAVPRTVVERPLERLVRRVRVAYGLSHTLTEPLLRDGRLIGALVLSRRVDGRWPDETRRLAAWAATEMSAALTRTYAHRAAESRATIDPLTGLLNRRAFNDLAASLSSGRRAGDVVGVLVIDVDHFKVLNDRYGHAAGDEVLRRVAAAIARCVRSGDAAARWGGEEFVVVLRHTSRRQACEVAERIRATVAALSGEELGVAEAVRVSVGVAVTEPAAGPTDAATVSGLLERADAALYAAKRAGRDRVLVA